MLQEVEPFSRLLQLLLTLLGHRLYGLIQRAGSGVSVLTKASDGYLVCTMTVNARSRSEKYRVERRQPQSVELRGIMTRETSDFLYHE